MKVLFSVILSLSLLQGISQNIHLSQYHKSEIAYNPANTGDFKGCFRFGSNYRNQWRGINAYAVHIEESFRDKSFSNYQYGIGAYFYHENAGVNGLKNTYGLMSAGISKYIDYDKKHYLSIGLQFGFAQRLIDLSSVSFLNQFNNIDEFDTNINSNENYNSNSSFTERANVGIKHQFKPTKGFRIITGAAILNLTQPFDQFNQEKKFRSHMHIVVHNELSMMAANQHQIKTLFLADFANKSSNITFGSMLHYFPEDENKIKQEVEIGILYRMYDAIILSGGIIKNKHNLSLSYDIISSGLTAGSGFFGNFELGYFFTLDCKPVLPDNYQVPCIRL